MPEREIEMDKRWTAMQERRRLRQTVAGLENRPIEPEVEAIAQAVETWEGERISTPPGISDPERQPVTVLWKDFVKQILELKKRVHTLNGGRQRGANENIELVSSADVTIGNWRATLSLNKALFTNVLFITAYSEEDDLQPILSRLNTTQPAL